MASPSIWLNLFRTMFLMFWVFPSSALSRYDSRGASRSRWISLRMASSPYCPICSLMKQPTILNSVPYSILVSITMQLCRTQFSRQRSQMFLMCRLTFLFFLRHRQRWSRKQSPFRFTKCRLCSLFLMVMQLQSDCSLNCSLPSLRTFPLELRRYSPPSMNYSQISYSPFMSMLLISLSASLQMQTRSQLCYRVESGCSGQLSSTSSAYTFRKQITSLPSLSYSTIMPLLVVFSSISEILLSFLVKDLSNLAECMRKILNQTASSKTKLYTSDLKVTKHPSSVLSLCRSARVGANLNSSFEAYKNTGFLLSLRLCFSISCSARMKQRQFLFSFLLVKVSFIPIIDYGGHKQKQTQVSDHFKTAMVWFNSSLRPFRNTVTFSSMRYGRSKLLSFITKTSARYFSMTLRATIQFYYQYWSLTLVLLSLSWCLSLSQRQEMSMKMSRMSEQMSYLHWSASFSSLWPMYSLVTRSKRYAFSILEWLAKWLSSLQMLGEQGIMRCSTLLNAQKMEESLMEVKKNSISLMSIQSSVMRRLSFMWYQFLASDWLRSISALLVKMKMAQLLVFFFLRQEWMLWKLSMAFMMSDCGLSTQIIAAALRKIICSLGGGSWMSYFAGKSYSLNSIFWILKSQVSILLVSPSSLVDFDTIFWKMTLAILLLPDLASPISSISIVFIERTS